MLLEYTDYIRQTISRFSANMSRKGSVVDEMAVKPVAALLSDVNDSMANIVSSLDISQAATWTDSQLAMYGDRWHLPWVTGSRASGYVRLYVEAPADTQIVRSRVTAYSRQSLTFVPSQDYNISRLEFTYDKARSLYWIDIPMVASGYGTNYNIDANSITRIDGVGISYSAVINPVAFINGSPGESRDEYITRLQYAPSDRGMTGYRSIMSTLKNFFPAVRSVYIAGSGDEYMERDILPIPGNQTVKTSFLGKTPGVYTVPHTAYADVFPPEASSMTVTAYGPSAPVTSYDFPVTVVSANFMSTDPGLRGFRLSREFDQAMYAGLYFDDGVTGSRLQTSNIIDQGDAPDFTALTPSSDWIIGDRTSDVYAFGQHRTAGNTDVPKADLVKMSSSVLTMKTGTIGEYTYASAEMNRNSGVVVRGRIAVSTAVGSDHMVMIASDADSNVFAGLGFGMTKIMYDVDLNVEKWVVYLTHNNKSSTSEIFAKPGDLPGYLSNTGLLGQVSTLAETMVDAAAIDGQDVWFSLYVSPDYEVTLSLVDMATAARIATLSVTGPVSKQIKNSIANNPAGFGTRVRLAAKCNSDDIVTFQDVIVRDLNERRPTVLMLLDISGFPTPVRLYLQARGSGASSGQAAYGHSTYIWDNEYPAVNGTIAGGWTKIDELSEVGSVQDAFVTGQTYDLVSVDRYRCSQVHENLLAIMVTTAGASYTATGFGDQDIEAEVSIDMFSITPESEVSARLGNCVDLYVNTYNNTESRPLTTISQSADDTGIITISPSEPIMEVVSIVDQTNADITANTKTVSDPLTTDPYRFKVYTYSPGQTFTVTYRPYYGIAEIQTHFDSSKYGSITGGVKVLHKNPVDLSIVWSYSGSQDSSAVDTAIRAYVDSRPDEVFDMQLCFKALNAAGMCTAIGPDSRVSYTDPTTGDAVVSSKAVVRPVDFFRIISLEVSRI